MSYNERLAKGLAETKKKNFEGNELMKEDIEEEKLIKEGNNAEDVLEEYVSLKILNKKIQRNFYLHLKIYYNSCIRKIFTVSYGSE